MKVRIDKEKCLECGACIPACPEGFEWVNGEVKIKNENADCISKIALYCPTKAIIQYQKNNV